MMIEFLRASKSSWRRCLPGNLPEVRRGVSSRPQIRTLTVCPFACLSEKIALPGSVSAAIAPSLDWVCPSPCLVRRTWLYASAEFRSKQLHWDIHSSGLCTRASSTQKSKMPFSFVFYLFHLLSAVVVVVVQISFWFPMLTERNILEMFWSRRKKESVQWRRMKRGSVSLSECARVLWAVCWDACPWSHTPVYIL